MLRTPWWVLCGLTGCVGLPPPPPTINDNTGAEPGTTTAASGSSFTPDPSATSDASTSGSMPDSSGSAATTPSDTTEAFPSWVHEITLSGHSAGPLQDVPVRVTLQPSELVDVGGPEDIYFLAADGSTLLPFEVDSWSETEAEVWVLAPQVLTMPTSIWLGYGTPTVTPPPSTEVWSGAYGVWHLDEQLLDSSPLANHGSAQSLTNAGFIGPGRSYDGEQYDELPPMLIWVDGTVQLWFRGPPEHGSDLSMLFHSADSFQADGLGNGDAELYLSLHDDEGQEAQFRSYGAGGFDSTILNQNGSWLDGQWHHLAATWTPGESQATLFVDGAQVDDTTNVAGFHSGLVFMRLGGCENNPNRSFNGHLDEVRVYDTAHTPARVVIEYAAQLPDFAIVGPALPLG